MPPFVYQPIVNPYANTIAEMILRSADPQARAAVEAANARARALEISGQATARAQEIGGQAWANAARGVGDAVSGAIAQATDPRLKIQALQLQELQARAADANRQRAGVQALDTLMGGDRLPAGDVGPRMESYVGEDGLFDVPKLTRELARMGYGAMAPDLVKGAEAINDSIAKHQKSEQDFANARTVLIGDLANGVTKLTKLGIPMPDAMDLAAEPALLARRIKREEYEPFKAKILALPPDQQAAALNSLMDAAAQVAGPKTLGKDALEVDRYGREIQSNRVPEPGKGDYTINGQRFKADGTPVGPPVPKQVEPPKPGTPEDWVSRDLKLAAAKVGRPLTDVETKAVTAQSLQQYKETNADPVLRDAAIAQKNVATALANLQLNMAPTKEQAASVAEDLVNHRIAPEQLATLFSTRGKEGMAFKLAVTAEAKKLDPSFNFEEASATYGLVKSPSFQQTVRYMDAVVESIPRLEQAAARLGNGRFRTLNDIANAAANQFNSTDLKAFKTDALLVGDEIAKILQGGGSGSATSDAKLRQASEIISTSDNVPAIAAAVKEIQFLIGNRRRTLTKGTYMEGSSAVPSAAGGVIYAKDPSGNVHQAPAGTPLPPGWVQVEKR